MEGGRVTTTRSEPEGETQEMGAWLAPPSVSHYRENLLEHVFISEVLQECAFARRQKVEVLRPEVDDGGYDIVLQLGPIIRHVQLKSRFSAAKGRSVPVNANLERHLGGCVVWLFWEVDPDSKRSRLTYRWFGNGPRRRTKALPERAALHPKTGAIRPNVRTLKWGDFEEVPTTSELVVRLFGRAPGAARR
jgi:hypothetical protein